MFSLKTLQKKIDQQLTSPSTRDGSSDDRKSQKRKTSESSSATRKRHRVSSNTRVSVTQAHKLSVAATDANRNIVHSSCKPQSSDTVKKIIGYRRRKNKRGNEKMKENSKSEESETKALINPVVNEVKGRNRKKKKNRTNKVTTRAQEDGSVSLTPSTDPIIKKHGKKKCKKKGTESVEESSSSNCPDMKKDKRKKSKKIQKTLTSNQPSTSSREQQRQYQSIKFVGPTTYWPDNGRQQEHGKTDSGANSFTSRHCEAKDSDSQDSDVDTRAVMESNSDSETGTEAQHYHNSDSEGCVRCKEQRQEDSVMDDTRKNGDLIGECISVTETESNSLVAALHPGTTLYLQGCVVVSPLLGSIEVLGYVLQQGQSQPILSLPTSSLLGVTALEGDELDLSGKSFQQLPSTWLNSLVPKTKDGSVVLLEVRRHTSPRLKCLISAGHGFLEECRERQKPWHSVGTTVVTHKNFNDYHVTNILPEWKEAAQTIAVTTRCGTVPRVVVCGGQGVGKSTFFRYLANTLLSAKPDRGAICLDFDPGQPELSLPSSLSLTHLTKPLLGPAYTHDIRSLASHHKHILVGAVTPQFALEKYAAAMRELCRGAEAWDEVPLLVNTMGWTQGTGLALMLDVIRLVRPTHVIQIRGRKARQQYPYLLNKAMVETDGRGFSTHPGMTELYYSLIDLPHPGIQGSGPLMSHPRALRELRLLAEAVQACEHGCQVTVPWSKVALHVCEGQVPGHRILQVINAQLVALCCVSPDSLHTRHSDLPLFLPPHGSFGEVLGWGVVMGIDPLTSHLHITTLLPPEQVSQQVNAIVMPNMHLPNAFYKYVSPGKAPYMEKVIRQAGGRLTVGRKNKAGAPK